MYNSGVLPNQYTYAIVLSVCARLINVELGEQLHSGIVKMGFEFDSFCEGSLIDMYAKCGNLVDARRVFDGLLDPDTVSWTAMISGYLQVGFPEEALKVFQDIQRLGHVPDQVAYVTVINAFVGLGRLGDALCLFSQMPNPNVIAWNLMISGHAKWGYEMEAVTFFQSMTEAGVQPTRSTLGSVLSAIASVANLQYGLQIHTKALKLGLDSNVYVGSSLINMYAKCKRLDKAKEVSEGLTEKNEVLWNALLAGYSQNGYALEVVKLFMTMRNSDLQLDEFTCTGILSACELYQEMLYSNTMPDQVTFASILKACSMLASLRGGQKIHSNIFHSGFDKDELTVCALVDMYAKCGDVRSSEHVFDKKDVISWNSMIVGFAKNGYADNALEIFEEMKRTNIKPDEVTLLGILTACSHAGMVLEGRQIFDDMTVQYGIQPRVDHCACMIDLFGRWGFLEEADKFIQKLKFEPDSTIWASYLGACQLHGDYVRGQRAAEKLIELEPHNSSPYVLLSNIYAASGQLTH